MPTIISETFADGDDQGLELGAEEWGREFSIGSDWTRLRIGILFNIVPNGTSNLANASLRIGASQAAAKHVGSGSGKLWYGMLFGGATTALTGGTWTYNAGSGNPYYTLAGYGRARQLDTTMSGTVSSGVTFTANTNDGSTKRRSVAFCDLNKNGTDMQVNGSAIASGSHTAADITLAMFRGLMADAGWNSAGYSMNYGGSQIVTGVPVATLNNHDTNAGTYGETVAAQIGWNIGLVSLLRIYAIEVYRHA